jgi:predicted amidohydrolase YtcJ
MKTYEGTIISCDPNNHVYKYLVEDKGRILYVGDNLTAEHGAAPRDVLGERALLPCFGDTHIHFASFALFNAGLDVRSARSLPELAERVLKFAK